jgi:2-oxoglutarate ferredoxin oxidoreductase subunit gamma
MERELLITGIGGQGVQLAAQVLARAATLEGREVMYLGLYGGMMRGGNTDSTVVVGDGPIQAPPVVSRAWSAIGMHDEYWADVERRLRPGGLALVNHTTFGREVAADVTTYRLRATEAAAAADAPLGGSHAMLAAYAHATGVVGIDALVEAMRRSIPSYRTQHIAANERAIRAGADLLPALAHPFWAPTPEAARA